MPELLSPFTLFPVRAKTPSCSPILTFKTALSFAIIGSTEASAVEFINNSRT